MTENTGFIYIVWPLQTLRHNLPIFKVGRTKDLCQRLIHYGKHTKLLFSCEVYNELDVETSILTALRASHIVKYRRDYGREYFECDNYIDLVCFVVNLIKYQAKVVPLSNEHYIQDIQELQRLTAITDSQKVKNVKKKEKSIQTEDKEIFPETVSMLNTCSDEQQHETITPKITDPDILINRFMDKFRPEFNRKTLKSMVVFRLFNNWLDDNKDTVSYNGMNHKRFVHVLKTQYLAKVTSHTFEDGVHPAVSFSNLLPISDPIQTEVTCNGNDMEDSMVSDTDILNKVLEWVRSNVAITGNKKDVLLMTSLFNSYTDCETQFRVDWTAFKDIVCSYALSRRGQGVNFKAKHNWISKYGVNKSARNVLIGAVVEPVEGNMLNPQG